MPLLTRRGFAGACAFSALGRAAARPNILLVVSDDQSWLHTGAAGSRAIATPAFDRVAREGVLFSHGFCSSPSCGPSRAAILTGQDFWRLEEAANMRAHLPARFATYTALLRAAGYRVGHQGKGYGPTDPKDTGPNPAGEKHPGFAEFLAATPSGSPFCYWLGSTKPHRPYQPGEWRKTGRWTLADAIVPPYLPDTPEVRGDLLDYFLAIEKFDRELAEALAVLDRSGLRDNTLVAVTSDNGMSFPRAKCNLYDWGVRMPLAIRWPAAVPGGRAAAEFASLTDLAPTFLEAAGLAAPPAMTGRSLMPLLTRSASGPPDPERSRVFFGRERHSVSREPAVGYPCRAMRTREFLYIRNFHPERWPAGDPPGTADMDPSPTRNFMVRNRDASEVGRLYALAFDRRPAEELYDLRDDPHQLTNLAAMPKHRPALAKASAELTAYLRKTGDPRVTGDGDIFDRRPFWGSTRHL